MPPSTIPKPMDNLERLDRYLDDDLPTDQRQQLEDDLRTDPALWELHDTMYVR